MTQYRVNTDYSRVRNTPTHKSTVNIKGKLMRGDLVNVIRMVTPPALGAIEWAEVRANIDGRTLDDMPLYIASSLLDKVIAEPPPASPGRILIGLNVNQNHRDKVREAHRLGCRFFLVFNDIVAAETLADEFTDSIFMARIYWNRNMPTPRQAFDALAGGRNARLIYTGLNEADECGQGGSGKDIKADEIRERARFDVELATMIKNASGARYAAGTFSVGTPEFNSQEVCDTIRAVYAPHYNSGLISWDHHLYSPDMQHIYKPDDHIWYETRWRFLFVKCGFLALSPSRVYCSETGVDKGGVGGFPANEASPPQIADWAKKFTEAQSQPMYGRVSPFVGGAIFQVGNFNSGTGGWAGYEVSYALNELHASGVWK